MSITSFINGDFRNAYFRERWVFSTSTHLKRWKIKIEEGKSRQQNHNILDREEKGGREPFPSLSKEALVGVESRENTHRRLAEERTSPESEEQCKPAAKYPQSVSSDSTEPGENAEHH